MKRKMMLCLLFVMLLCPGISAQAKTMKMKIDYKISIQTEKKAKVTLKWSKQKADGIDVYRKVAVNEGPEGKYKLVKSLKGSKKSFTDKVAIGKYYTYKVVAYTKSNGKKKKIATGVTIEKEIDVPACSWANNCPYDMETSTTQIPLEWSVYEGDTFDGIEIYRSEHGKNKFKKIATSKKIRYTDKKITALKCYDYKSRMFLKCKNGKKIYSKYSKVISLYANNHIGKYTVETVPNSEVRSMVTIKITSDKKNGKTIITDETYTLWDYETNKAVPIDMKLYSYDGVNWKKVKNNGVTKIPLDPGKEVYLRYEDKYIDKDDCFNSDTVESACIDVIYNGQIVDLICYFKNGVGEIEYDSNE